MATPQGLRSIATYAAGVGPEKDLLLPRSADGSMLPPTSLVADAHAAGLFVHAYTTARRDRYPAADLRLAAARTRHATAFGECSERLLVPEWTAFYATSRTRGAGRDDGSSGRG
jgi:glycerophosphoryl diester phosphodiesterase